MGSQRFGHDSATEQRAEQRDGDRRGLHQGEEAEDPKDALRSVRMLGRTTLTLPCVGPASLFIIYLSHWYFLAPGLLALTSYLVYI